MRVNLQFLTIILISLLCTISSHSQISHFKARAYYDTDGLSQNNVNVVMQDSHGYIWMGTGTGGLDKFDGNTFEHHKYSPYTPNGIAGNEIVALFEDSKGFIWAGTRNKGLSRYNPHTKHFKNYMADSKDSTALPSATVLSICEDDSGLIWIGTAWGLCTYSHEKDNFTTLNKGNKKNYYKGISSVTIVDKQHILVGTHSNGLYLLNINDKKIIKHWVHDAENPASLGDNQVSAISVDTEGQVWVGTTKRGISRLSNIKSDTFIHINTKTKPYGLANNYIEDILQDSNNNIWITSKGGIAVIAMGNIKLDTPKMQRFQEKENDNYSISQNATYCITEDRDGNFWVGTWSMGVNYITVKDNNFTHYQHAKNSNNTLLSPMVRATYKHDTKLYAGTQGGGLNVYNLNNKKYKYYKPDYKKNSTSITTPWVESINPFNEEYIAVGTNKGGINYFNIQTRKFTSYLVGKTARDHETLDNNIWLGTNDGLYVLDMNKHGHSPLQYKDEYYRKIGTKTHIIFKDTQNRIWTGSSLGIAVYKDTTEVWKKFKNSKNDPFSLSSGFINSITSDNENRIWIATSNGLNLFKEDSLNFISFGEWDGLPDNEIQNVFCDNSDRIWISSNKGLACFNFNPEAKDKKSMLQNMKTFKVEDGLQSNKFSRNSVYKCDDGEILIGGINGFNTFNPDEMTFNTIPPKVSISGFQLFNKPVEIGGKNSPLEQNILFVDEIILNHKQSVFSLNYAALNYTAAEKCEYAYTMEGIDDEWNYVGKRREANYTNLPAGEYTFKVKATNNDGIWSKEPTTLKITILPSWWNTWLFRIFMFIVISGALYYAIRRKTQQAKERRKELEALVQEATAESESKNNRLEEAKEKLSSIMEEVKTQLGKTSTDLMDASNSQASSIEEISSSIDQMAQEINESATGASKMFEDAKVVEDNSQKSVEIVGQTVTAIENISKDINYIQEFARTTNILSLNAAIESAKAGIHGKSFGVVAAEVKKLAESSQGVANNIKKLSDSGLKLSKEANQNIIVLQDYIKNIVSIISQIRNSTQSQSYEAANVNKAIQQISDNLNSTASLASELDAAIKSLSLE